MNSDAVSAAPLPLPSHVHVLGCLVLEVNAVRQEHLSI